MAALPIDKEAILSYKEHKWLHNSRNPNEQRNALESTLHDATTNTDAHLWYNTKLKGTHVGLL